MTAETGHLLLILATALMWGTACSLLWLPHNRSNFRLSQLLADSATLTLTASYLLLSYCFITDDFSVRYVADNSNSQLPLLYKVAAVWGSHEGSLLLWLLLLGGLLQYFRRSQLPQLQRQALAILAALSGAFGIVILLTANPFARLLPAVPPEGRDLNPILQDIGLILHPPLLFAGYALLGALFAICVAILLDGRFHQAWRALRQLSLLSWLFLSAGNVLGAWWAYTELGWGGWWFWDPVENAAFIPWLLSSALLHCLLPKQPSPQLARLSLLLGIITFGSCLLGTFLVRSGIVQSVHAFTSNSGRGALLLLLMALFLLPALWLYGRRCSQLKCYGEAAAIPLLLGIALLLAAAFSVLLGTLYPLFCDMLGLGTLSVGAPYFNMIFVPLLLLMTLLMGWSFVRRHGNAWLLLPWLLLSGLWVLLFPGHSPGFTFLGIAAASWLLLAEIQLWFYPHAKHPAIAGRIAHVAVAIAILGGTCSSQYETEALLRMSADQGRTLHSSFGSYSFVYRDTLTLEQRAYHAIAAEIELYRGQEQLLTKLQPQRQTFRSNGMEVTEAAVYHGWLQDFYVSLGQELEPGVYLVRISIKPLISWLWLGGLLLLPAALCACCPRIYRRLPIVIPHKTMHQGVAYESP
ncbi:heme lyase CcmF/NrfE family subunit [Shewanella dokdonensis]|uniref:Cytochrome c biogenesis protein CcsA n=1 Tax=Shewanella dokdonensis TaxID=712036 RepID=A0ABX8DBQ0_9GAMM|nr:cytochrome c-type biogenesis CcmF C-terminal domain-containing protein [Shewanella dokdonensis]MCL1075400.1 cytochrome c biogenesis protein CcsA [Shewanella dokdonensis]QVK22096.1 cytochrome c biogenesis protein CcsA [Shewanella dokdonensis]